MISESFQRFPKIFRKFLKIIKTPELEVTNGKGECCELLLKVKKLMGQDIYMLFTGWEVRIGKNCDRGLNMLTEASNLFIFPVKERIAIALGEIES